MRVAVTGAGGRLGSALVTALADAPFTGPAGPIAWQREAFAARRSDAAQLLAIEREDPHGARLLTVVGIEIDHVAFEALE